MNPLDSIAHTEDKLSKIKEIFEEQYKKPNITDKEWFGKIKSTIEKVKKDYGEGKLSEKDLADVIITNNYFDKRLDEIADNHELFGKKR